VDGWIDRSIDRHTFIPFVIRVSSRPFHLRPNPEAETPHSAPVINPETLALGTSKKTTSNKPSRSAPSVGTRPKDKNQKMKFCADVPSLNPIVA